MFAATIIPSLSVSSSLPLLLFRAIAVAAVSFAIIELNFAEFFIFIFGLQFGINNINKCVHVGDNCAKSIAYLQALEMYVLYTNILYIFYVHKYIKSYLCCSLANLLLANECFLTTIISFFFLVYFFK